MTSRMEGESVRSMTQRSIPSFASGGGHPEFEGTEKILIKGQKRISLVSLLSQLLDKGVR